MPVKTEKHLAGYSFQNTPRLVRGGKKYFDLLLELINGAQQSIHFHVYIFDEDDTGNMVAEALIQAAKRNVRVFLMVDGYGSKGLSGIFIEKMLNAGVQFKMFEPVFFTKHFYFGRRMHHKIVVVDAFHSLVSGINISDKYNDTGDNPAWLDWGLYVQGEVAIELLKICIRIWTKWASRARKLFSFEKLPETLPQEKCKVRVRRNDWVRRLTQINSSYLEMFRKANSHIIIMSSYFLPGLIFKQRLGRAAKRGIKIKLILAGISDVHLSKHAERYIYRWLLRHNIEIYELQKTILHGKLATYDGEFVTLGSYNVNNLSAYVSLELNLDVRDKEFAVSVDKEMERIIKQDCIQITEKECRHFNFIQRVSQYTAYTVIRFMYFIFTFYFKQRNL